MQPLSQSAKKTHTSVWFQCYSLVLAFPGFLSITFLRPRKDLRRAGGLALIIISTSPLPNLSPPLEASYFPADETRSHRSPYEWGPTPKLGIPSSVQNRFVQILSKSWKNPTTIQPSSPKASFITHSLCNVPVNQVFLTIFLRHLSSSPGSKVEVSLGFLIHR